jgi:MbtH protein
MMQDEDDGYYKVLVNGEAQYSLWLASHEIPNGWHEVSRTMKRADCLAYVKEVWTDMRPLSLKCYMDQSEPAAAGDESGRSVADPV